MTNARDILLAQYRQLVEELRDSPYDERLAAELAVLRRTRSHSAHNVGDLRAWTGLIGVLLAAAAGVSTTRP